MAEEEMKARKEEEEEEEEEEEGKEEEEEEEEEGEEETIRTGLFLIHTASSKSKLDEFNSNQFNSNNKIHNSLHIQFTFKFKFNSH